LDSGALGSSLHEKTLTSPLVRPIQAHAADLPYGVYASHFNALAAAAPAPASARSLKMGMKLYIFNLDPAVTIEDVQVLLFLLLV
jgi:hypothetical protein